MSDILCIYYSRSGNTKRAMEEIATALSAELVDLHDEAQRGGWRGYLRCGMDAMGKKTAPLCHYETEKALEDYRLVIVGTPVWAGRCSAPIRSFLKTEGKKLARSAFVITRGGETKYPEVFEQMDFYLEKEHEYAVSLQCSSVGCHFWQEEFIRSIKNDLDSGL